MHQLLSALLTEGAIMLVDIEIIVFVKIISPHTGRPAIQVDVGRHHAQSIADRRAEYPRFARNIGEMSAIVTIHPGLPRAGCRTPGNSTQGAKDPFWVNGVVEQKHIQVASPGHSQKQPGAEAGKIQSHLRGLVFIMGYSVLADSLADQETGFATQHFVISNAADIDIQQTIVIDIHHRNPG